MIALTNATIIDGTGRDPISGISILIEENRIRAIGKTIKIPAGTRTIDLQGATLLPGLIDTHVHFLMEYPNMAQYLITPPSLRLFQAIPRMRATLDAGVTTVRDAGGTPAGVKMAVQQGIIEGPRMLISVSIISQTGGHGDGYYPCGCDLGLFGLQLSDVPRAVADGEDEVRKVTRELLRAGADWIKLATTGGVLSTADAPTSAQLTIDEIKTAVYEAAAQGKRCMAHAQGADGIMNAIKAGVASIEHGIYLTDEAIELMLKKSVYLVPTLVAPLDVIDFSHEHPEIVPPMIAAKALQVVEAHQASYRRAIEAGVKIAMGTDSGVGRHGGNGRELSLMVKHGMTPMQSIQASTLHAARLLHLDDQLGTLEEGKRADMIVLSGNPLDDIDLFGNPDNVRLVIKDGRICKNLLEA
ncbi:imidazolonepropionase-like amidohydrolase [Thermosporothrix hazakensis]|jgi:imidazolonepropionase-like amidohydrolase|uniref:Imidazolonepropionase-like amidohydrolase n=1 Tax=Thermosporothrix hazakensis TaxID=644383 RepID=A0A326UG14_THEHA|nr:amidohydrolase family protein [Thermosporothrix hazakensis]PZW36845.1 imidazolonepropionase-like amidohydrolase [Thermosporothrix hazakensis]GCE47493.1 hydrolase [Thermosporothrix hazakensis]